MEFGCLFHRPFISPSTPCFIAFTAMFQGDAQKSCALLCPIYGGMLSDSAPMILFLHHIYIRSPLLFKEKMCVIVGDFADHWVSLENAGRFSHGDKCAGEEGYHTQLYHMLFFQYQVLKGLRCFQVCHSVQHIRFVSKIVPVVFIYTLCSAFLS